MAVILLVEGDDSLRQAGRDYLSGRGHSVVSTGSGADGLRALRHLRPDLIIYNADVQDMAIDEFHSWLRADPQNETTPVIYLVSPGLRTLVEAAITAGDIGRSRALARPFRWTDVEEVVQAMLAEGGSNPGGGGAGRAGGLDLSQESFELRSVRGNVVLTPTEFRLTQYLMRRANTLVGVDELLEQVWGYHPQTGSPEVVRAHVHNLRLKIGRVLPEGDVLQTVPRRGYRLVAASRTST
ncbi:MAG: response regulator transcription factor [Dehalococcoidia bacterium]